MDSNAAVHVLSQITPHFLLVAAATAAAAAACYQCQMLIRDDKYQPQSSDARVETLCVFLWFEPCACVCAFGVTSPRVEGENVV